MTMQEYKKTDLYLIKKNKKKIFLIEKISEEP